MSSSLFSSSSEASRHRSSRSSLSRKSARVSRSSSSSSSLSLSLSSSRSSSSRKDLRFPRVSSSSSSSLSFAVIDVVCSIVSRKAGASPSSSSSSSSPRFPRPPPPPPPSILEKGRELGQVRSRDALFTYSIQLPRLLSSFRLQSLTFLRLLHPHKETTEKGLATCRTLLLLVFWYFHKNG